MKRIVLILSFCLLLNLSSCDVDTSFGISHEYQYGDVESLMIQYKDIFLPSNSIYFCYFYSLNCLHCELLKDDIIAYALSNKVATYFIQVDGQIPIIDDVSTTIGADEYFDVGIFGTPTLILIENGFLSLNVAGEDLIKSVLEEYN